MIDERKNRVLFTKFASSKIRLQNLNMISDTLVDVWRYCLNDVEKYYLWYLGFNSLDRVRLWNKLTFSREWFEKVIVFSKEQVVYKNEDQKIALFSKKHLKMIDDEENYTLVRHDLS